MIGYIEECIVNYINKTRSVTELNVYVISCILAVILTYTINNSHRISNENKIRNGLPSKEMGILSIILAVSPLIYVSAVRFFVGTDYPIYMQHFNYIADGGTVEDYEYLFHKLNEVIAAFGKSYRWLFAICTFLFMVPLSKAIFRDSPYPALSVFLLVGTTHYFSAMNGIRQMIAVAILVYSLKYVLERRFVPFALLTIIAGGFHSSSYTFIIVYFLYNQNFNLIFVIVSTVIIYVFAPILAKGVNYIVELTKYEHYLESVYNEKKQQGIVTMMMRFAIIAFCIVFYDEDDKKFQLYYKLHIISTWITAFMPYVPLMNRFRSIYSLSVIILIPITVSKIQNKKLRLWAIWGVVALYTIYAVYNLLVYNTSDVLPYYTIFQAKI